VISIAKRRLRVTSGFTLIELLVVMVVLAVLLAIAVPAYLKFKDRAHGAAAPANIRAALPAVEAYKVDHDGYAGMTPAELKIYDAAVTDVTVESANATTYCLKSLVAGAVAYKNGPDGPIVVNPPAPPCP
jgi:prepilin-type N-terminal cleavage/methylation domain-containing protein